MQIPLRTAILFWVIFFAACSAIKKPLQTTDPIIRQTIAQHDSLKAKLPFDKNITKGKLANGLTYYIRKNLKPENRAELRLAVNAGSILEDENQQGLAHFVEHMAFNGTESFKKQELVDYLESIGMRFGPDLNAYTSFDETVYMLQVATDSSEILENGFKVLEEWAHRLLFDEAEIDKERGVVIEEWRLGRGAQARLRDKQFPILFKGSQYARRLPIGKKEIVQNAGYQTIKRFYQDWYRPDLMAVVAVGDFDENSIETLIKKYFSAIPKTEHPRKRMAFPVPDNKEPLIAVASDPEATSSRVNIYYKHQVRKEGSEGVYRQALVEALYSGVFNKRLNELRQKPNPPFLFGFSGRARFVRTKEFYILGAGVPENQIETGLEALLTEAERIKKFGITQSELDREKTELLRGMELAFNERDKTNSSGYAAEYIRNFLTGEPVPGIEKEFELYQKFIPTITLAEVNKLTGTLITEENRVILSSVPEKTGINIPTEEGLLAVFQKVSQKQISPYVDSVTDAPLVASPPDPGKILTQTQIAKLGVTEWVLSNGIKVIFKSTDFKNDQIIFSAYSPGGNSLVENQDYTAAITAASIISQSGVGDFNRIALDKKLAGKAVGVSPSIGELSEGISGGASPQDLETMFQLIYLYFTAPRKDPVAFQSYQSRIKSFLENRGADPGNTFQDTIDVTMAQYHFRSKPLSPAFLEEMDLERSLAIYQNRFADAGDFTFFFVGNIDPVVFKKHVQTYLAGLPNTNRNETWKDIGMTSPKGVINKSVRNGLEDKSRVRIIFTGPFEWSRQNRYNLNAMASVLRIKLRETLREDKGGTYGVSVNGAPSHYPKETYRLTISFGCAPHRVEELTEEVFLQIDSLKQFGSAYKYLQKVKEAQRRKNEIDLKSNSYWLNTLRFYYIHKEDPKNILETGRFIENLKLQDIRNAAQKYLNTRNYAKFVLFPENKD